MTYDKFKEVYPKVSDGWYLVKDGLTYKVDLPINTKFTKRVNILTGEVYYPSNADRIRAMTDEELAEWILREPTIGYFAVCPPGTKDGGDCPTSPCEQCWLDWLKQEVDNGT